MNESNRNMREPDTFTPDELRQTAAGLRDQAGNIETTPAARHAFTQTADLIERVAGGFAQPVEAEIAISLIGPMLDAEGVRRVRLVELYGELNAGLEAWNGAAWRRAISEALQLMTDDQVLNIATVLDVAGFFDLDPCDTAQDGGDLVLVHDEPAGVQ